MPDPTAPERTDLIARLRFFVQAFDALRDDSTRESEISHRDMVERAADALEASPEPPVREPVEWLVEYCAVTGEWQLWSREYDEGQVRVEVRWHRATFPHHTVRIVPLYAGEPELFEPEVGDG